ncbi:MAG: ABC transporter permease [Candidatus Thorarchaeota archaeon]|nr:ABC transporter permease [Candidatus Thorarchaeota archaeon]
MTSAGEKKNSKLWRIYSMFRKEIRLIQNDKFAMLLVFALPGMIMGTMFVAISGGGSSMMGGNSDVAMTLGIVDLDNTDTYPGEDLSFNFTLYLQASDEFDATVFETEDAALLALYRDDVKAYAVIPYGFEGNITGDIPAFVNIHISSSEFESQATVFSAFSNVVTKFRYDHGWIKGEVATNTVREFEPVGNRTAATFGAFLLVFGVFIGVSATAAQAIVGDVPLNRMLLTPATKMESIISKTLAYFILGVVQSVFLLALWWGLFGIQPNTSWLVLFFILCLMSISGSALGVVISTLVTTRLQANQSFLFLLFGSLIVGTGFMDVGIIDDVFPLNLGRAMIIDTAFKGISLANFVGEINVIILFSIGLIVVAWVIFAKRTTLA